MRRGETHERGGCCAQGPPKFDRFIEPLGLICPTLNATPRRGLSHKICGRRRNTHRDGSLLLESVGHLIGANSDSQLPQFKLVQA